VEAGNLPAKAAQRKEANMNKNYRIMMKRPTITAFGALLVFLTGCGTTRIREYQPASPSVSERTAQESGVTVALDPFVEKARTEKYFDINAVANGIAILHVRVANRTTDRTFLVKKEGFQLVRDGAGGLTGDGKKIERSQATGDALGVTGAVLSGLGGSGLLLVGSAIVSHATEVQRNFTSKEMGDQTLSPGESMEGFIYFAPLKHGEDWTRTAAVKARMADTKTRQFIEFNVPLAQ
jgi:hypothetical protein